MLSVPAMVAPITLLNGPALDALTILLSSLEPSLSGLQGIRLGEMDVLILWVNGLQSCRHPHPWFLRPWLIPRLHLSLSLRLHLWLRLR